MRSRKDNTALSCLAIVAVAGTLNIGKIAPTQPNTYTDWWDISCWFAPSAPWCPRPIKEPALPAPEITPDPPPCSEMGPCPETR